MAQIEFCGELMDLDTGAVFTVGRNADLVIDDNPFLHRRFLQLYWAEGMWWIANVGTQLSATLADARGLVEAYLSPGARLPVVFPEVVVWFTAGPTTYEFALTVDQAPFEPSCVEDSPEGTTTTGRASFTPEQRLLVLGLAEPLLRSGRRGTASVPSSTAAAARLGWTVTKFNRKLDNVCSKLERLGVRGLHGGPDRLAANRKARLVEYALATRLVTPDDLVLLDKAGFASE